ncbi:hypothetical protein G9A89_023749 [Geosiphon pyriformis]|nr:hypothetical protein G9A89_023749 [Geosiphon pyriformis]
MPEEQDFHHTALSEDRAAAQQQQNSSYTSTTIPPARIAENANLSDIFSFEFEANKSLFLLSNAAANEQKAIMAMYTEAEVKGKTIRLILDSGSAGSIITYQLMQQLKRNVDRPAQTVIITANDMKKTPVGEIDNFPFTLNGITIPIKVLVIDAPQYQALVPAICNTFNKHSEKAPAFEFELEEEKPLIETFMALKSTSNWANETEQEHFTSHIKPKTSGWNIPYSKPEPRKQHPYILFKYKNCHKKLSSMGACISPKKEYENYTYNTSCLTCEDMLPEECNWIDVAMRRGVCNQTCQYALSISEKVKRGTPFNAAYNSALNKLYHYPHDAEMIFNLAMVLINRATKKDVCQMKEAEYIKYTMELARFDYEDKVEVYYQITSHTYPIQEAQIQQLEQMNIRLCEEYIMPCDKQWCPKCYTLSIFLPSKNDEYKIEFGELEVTKEIETTPIYLIKNQSALQLKYFNNNGQGIKPKKAHEINAEYDLRYSGKDTLTLKPKFLTKINLKLLSKFHQEQCKKINVREGIIDAGYTEDITVMLQNETDKPFKIGYAEKIAQAIYLPLINISGLQLVNQREQLGKSERGIQGFGSTGCFTVSVNIALNEQKESHQILQLPQPITISPFGEHPEIYIFLLNNLEIGIIYSNIFQQELPQTVPNFSEIIGHSLPKINPNPSSENYHIVMEKLSRINMGQLEPQQQNQFKKLIADFADIFAKNNNDLGRTDLVQHQIYIGDAKPR